MHWNDVRAKVKETIFLTVIPTIRKPNRCKPFFRCRTKKARLYAVSRYASSLKQNLKSFIFSDKNVVSPTTPTRDESFVVQRGRSVPTLSSVARTRCQCFQTFYLRHWSKR